jgi:hypothetical protein
MNLVCNILFFIFLLNYFPQMNNDYKINEKIVEINGFIMYSTIYESLEGFNGIPQDIIIIISDDYDIKKTLLENLEEVLRNKKLEVYEEYFQLLKWGIPDLKEKLNEVYTEEILTATNSKIWKSFKVFYGTLLYDTSNRHFYNEDSFFKSDRIETICLNISRKKTCLSYGNMPRMTGILKGFYSIDKPNLNAFSDYRKFIKINNTNHNNGYK